MVHFWRRRAALLHDGGVQPQAEVAATRAASEEALQALGADLAEGSGLDSESWLKQFCHELEPLKP